MLTCVVADILASIEVLHCRLNWSLAENHLIQFYPMKGNLGPWLCQNSRFWGQFCAV